MSAPRVFMSYSHDSEEHKQWVFDLAWRLRSDFGIDVLLDAWDVRLGGDLPRFMEGIADSDKVLMVCSEVYSKKCDESRRGGVAYEKMMVTPKIVENVYGETIIPVMRNNQAGLMPAFVRGKLFIDFRDDVKYEIRLRQLAASIHGIDGIKPPIGLNPFRQGLDAGFGVDGKRVLAEQQLLPLRLNCLADGVLVFGRINDELLIIRLALNGDLDDSFAEGGILRFKTGSFDVPWTDATPVPDGLIITPRHDLGGEKKSAQKYLLTGDVENFSSDFPFQALLAEGTSAIFLSGHDALRFMVLDQQGRPDPSIGGDGRLCIRLPPNFHLNWVRAKVIGQSVFVFGKRSWESGSEDAMLYKFSFNGEIDHSFGEDGCCNLSRSVWFSTVSDVVQMENEGLVVGGSGNEANIISLTANGLPDKSFGTNGVVEFRASGRSTCEKIELFENSIVFAGNASDGRSKNEVYVAKLMLDGRVDESFHGEGFISISIKNRDSVVDFCIQDRALTLLCQSDCDAPKHFRTGLTRVHL